MTIEEVAEFLNTILRGWVNYFSFCQVGTEQVQAAAHIETPGMGMAEGESVEKSPAV